MVIENPIAIPVAQVVSLEVIGEQIIEQQHEPERKNIYARCCLCAHITVLIIILFSIIVGFLLFLL